MNVNDLFANSSVLITGVTGFLGKVLLEKLLRSCDGIDHIYVLVRTRKNMTCQQRLENVLKSEAFYRLRDENPKVFEKVVVIPGDVSGIRLGLNETDRHTLISNVNFVFHVASTVRFNEELKVATSINVRGVYEMLQLAMEMTKLKVFLYVSTAYSNCDHGVIEERIYPYQGGWMDLISMAEQLPDETLNNLSPKLIGGHPNTYTFTKHVAENIVNDYKDKLPVVVYRPAIVCFALQEPVIGWVDNLNGQTGLSVGVLTGVQHVIYGNSKLKTNIVPVDYCVNGCIVAAWYRCTRVDNNECPVFNAVIPNQNCLKIEDTSRLMRTGLQFTPFEKMLTYPRWIYINNWTLYKIIMLLVHVIPGLIFDAVFKLKGISFRLMPLYRRIHMTNEVTSFFLINEFEMKTKHYETLFDNLSQSDKENFKCDLITIDNMSLTVALNCMKGLKRFIMKEQMDELSVQRAKKRLRILYWVEKIMLMVLFFVVAVLVIKKKIIK